MITRKDVEFAGPYGRAIVRLRDGFYELYWKGSEYACAKLYPSYKLGSEDEAVADALQCVSRNKPPPAGSRSLRRTTARGLAPVEAT